MPQGYKGREPASVTREKMRRRKILARLNEYVVSEPTELAKKVMMNEVRRKLAADKRRKKKSTTLRCGMRGWRCPYDPSDERRQNN